MFHPRKKKKIISGFLIGFGIGILLVLFLPINAWLTIIGIVLIIIGISIILDIH